MNANFHGVVLRLAVAVVIGFVAASCSAQSLDGDISAEDATPDMEILSEAQWRRVDGAVERGLAWLASQQLSDGSLPTDMYGNPGVTSLGVLAMLSSHHLPDDGKYGPSISRAIDFVITSQKRNGLISLVGPDDPAITFNGDGGIGGAAPYNHAISSLALSEVYAMTGDQRSDTIRKTIERALAVTIQLQQRPKYRQIDHGGWRYLNRNREMDSDLSVTGWYLMSLRSAKNAGFEVRQQSIDDAVGYVTRCFNEREGVFHYGRRQARLRSRGMAASGILALAHAGLHHSPMARRSGDWILQNPLRQYNEIRFEKDTFHYGAFYCCQAMYQLGGDYWADFFPRTAMLLVDAQRRDGSWPSDASGAEGKFGPTYSTALAVLALSAPNQVLPIFQR
jgi:hypothetical protein